MSEWAEHAERLAEWSLKLVNRSDTFGRYAGDGSVYTVTPGSGAAVDRRLLENHFRATNYRDVIGLHAIDTSDKCRWVLLDFDSHAETGQQQTAEVNRRFAIAVSSELEALGFDYLLTDSNGSGGFHLRVVFETPVSAGTAESFGQWLLRNWESFGLNQRPESFPKSGSHKTSSGKNLGGGWCRLPGLHPKRGVMATVWNGTEFVDGQQVVERILATRGNDSSLIPNEAKTFKTERQVKENQAVLEAQRAELRTMPAETLSGLIDPLDVARDICNRHPGSVSGQESENNLLRLFKRLFLGCGLTVSQAVAVVASEWNHKCTDASGSLWPFTLQELQHKAEDSHRANAHNADLRAVLWAEAKLTGDYSKVRPIATQAIENEDYTFEVIPNRTPEVDSRPVRSLEDIRNEMYQRRLEVINKPGMYIDRSGVGSGKSYYDRQMAITSALRGKRVALMLPSHALARAELQAFQADEAATTLNVKVIEPRATSIYVERNPEAVENCWNVSADIAESQGLPATTVCQFCTERDKCSKSGFLKSKREAMQADILIATTQRATQEGFTELCDGRDVILCHENTIDCVQPFKTFGLNDLQKLKPILEDVAENPEHASKYFDRPDLTVRTAEGRARQRELIKTVLSFVVWLLAIAESSDESTEVKRSWSVETVPGTFWALWRTIRGDWFSEVAGTLKLNSAALTGIFGYLQQNEDNEPRLMIQVDDIRSVGNDSRQQKTLTVTWKNLPPDETVSIFSDGTADIEQLTAVSRPRDFVDITPHGRAQDYHGVVQHIDDVTGQTAASVPVKIVRSVLEDRPEIKRLGVICLLKHRPEIEKLREETGRIAQITHFRSGIDTGSNLWVDSSAWNCDLLLIIGTPRPNSGAVRRRLFQISDPASCYTAEQAGWEEYLWTGQTTEGKTVEVRTKGYADRAWQRAYESLTHALIRQAVGRARITIEDQGIPVFIISREPLGLPVLKWGALPILSKTHSEVLRFIREAGAIHLSTKQVSVLVGLTDRRTREVTTELQNWGYITRTGKRSGWKIDQVETEQNPRKNNIGFSSVSRDEIPAIDVPPVGEISRRTDGIRESLIRPDDPDFSGIVEAFDDGTAGTPTRATRPADQPASQPLHLTT